MSLTARTAAYIATAKVIPTIQGSSNGVVVALASRDPDKGRGTARDLEIGRVHTSYEALIEDPEEDAVSNMCALDALAGAAERDSADTV